MRLRTVATAHAGLEVHSEAGQMRHLRVLAALLPVIITVPAAHAAWQVRPSSAGFSVTDGSRVVVSSAGFSAGAKPALTTEANAKTNTWSVKVAPAMGRAPRFTATADLGPDAFLCRLTPGQRTDVVQLSIGDVESRLCDALFSPKADLGLSFTGKGVRLQRTGTGAWTVTATSLERVTVEQGVYVNRGIKYYTPLDKSVFKRAPAGWCSWYEYYQGISEDAIVANVKWLAKNLKPFGCDYVQIDDGWQGVGHGNGENRDWFVTDKRFPHGMKWLADQIRAEGFTPGIWLCPFGESDQALFKSDPKAFVRRPDGTSIGENLANPDTTGANERYNWVGRDLVDPTTPEGQAYLKKLFHMLCLEWGYDYVKIDGQGGMPYTYEDWRKQLGNSKLTGEEAYRFGLEALRSQMGKKRFLLNCGGAWSSVGLCEGIRIGGDIGASWSGMQPAIDCTMRWLFLNNIAFYTDPDAVCVRSPLTPDQARMWATMVGITGQLLMASDDMTKLPADRVDMLKRIFPVADIRPMCLYPQQGRPPIFDLKVARPWGSWDVVALFNWGDTTSKSISVGPEDLGLPPGAYVYYDAWAKRIISAGNKPLRLDLAPTSCRLITVHKQDAPPFPLGTSRHITQGADDLQDVKWDAAMKTLSGKSHVVAGDPYELLFHSWPNSYPAAQSGLKEANYVTTLTLPSDRSGWVPWKVEWGTAPLSEPGIGAPSAPRLAQLAGGAVQLSWQGDPRSLGYTVYRNGVPIGQTVETSLRDTPRAGARSFVYEVSAYNWDGSQETARVPVGTVGGQSVHDAWLDEIAPTEHSQEYGELRLRRSVDDHPLLVAGRKFEHGLGTHASSAIVYDVSGYARFTADVGVDDEKDGNGSVGFEVYLDGKKVFDSGVVHGHASARHVDVPLAGHDTLRLVVNDGGDGINCDHADWGDARLTAQ